MPLISILLGLAWNAIVSALMSGRPQDAFTPSWLAAGAIAGLTCGRYTVRSRLRRDGAESFAHVLATYYLGMVVYWAVFVVVQRVTLCIRARGWTDFDLHDHLVLIWWFFAYGTLKYGILLIPLAFLSRLVIWKVHRASARGEMHGA